jgi:chromosome partitioning protein
MSVLAVLNQKGGSGKSTTACNVAVELLRRGWTVAILDTDEQGSASDWRALRIDERIPVFGATRAASLPADARTQAKSYDVVIIDGVPNVSDLTAAAVKVADAVIIPVQPAPRDIWGASDLVDLIRTRHIVSEGVPQAAFLVSRATEGTILARGIDDALLKMGLPVFNTRLHDRQLFKQVDLTGLGVTEAEPGSAASKEVVSLVDELIENNFVRKQ